MVWLYTYNSFGRPDLTESFLARDFLSGLDQLGADVKAFLAPLLFNIALQKVLAYSLLRRISINDFALQILGLSRIPLLTPTLIRIKKSKVFEITMLTLWANTVSTLRDDTAPCQLTPQLIHAFKNPRCDPTPCQPENGEGEVSPRKGWGRDYSPNWGTGELGRGSNLRRPVASECPWIFGTRYIVRYFPVEA